MRMLRTIEAGPKILPSNVAVLEQHYGVCLPAAYREFLLARNGGRPERDLFPVPGCQASPVARVHFFFGINDPVESCSLSWNIDLFRERLETNLLPIATTEGADKICIILDTGAVMFLDGYSDSLTSYRVASSFEAFLDVLYRDENSPQVENG